MRRCQGKKSKRERNIQAFVRSEAHQITRNGKVGVSCSSLFRLIHSKFCFLYCTLSIEKTPASSPGPFFDSLALEKTQKALKRRLGRGVPPKVSIPNTLFNTKIVGGTKMDRPSPTFPSFFRHPVQAVHPENKQAVKTIPLLCEAAFSRYKLLFLFARQLMSRKRSLCSQGSGARAGAQPFRPHKEVPTTVSPALWRGRSRGKSRGGRTGSGQGH